VSRYTNHSSARAGRVVRRNRHPLDVDCRAQAVGEARGRLSLNQRWRAMAGATTSAEEKKGYRSSEKGRAN